MKPGFSVVIPTRNRPELLARCLDRLAPGAQALPADQYEVIVTDDGDDDQTRRLLAERYPWCRYTGGPRRGPAANRNHGVSAVLGEWLTFTDDDCVPSSGWLAALDRAVRPGAEVYEGRTTCVGGVPSPMYFAPINSDGGYLWSCNMMVATTLFWSMGGFDERFPHAHMEDVDFRERVKQLGKTLVFVPEAIVDHPARPVALARVRARDIECEMIYRFKHGHAQPSRRAALLRQARNRQRAITAYPLSRDSMRAAKSALEELLIVAQQYKRWLQRYRLR